MIYSTRLHQSDSFQLAHLSPHGIDSNGQRIQEIPGRSSSFLFFSDDSHFPRLPEDEQLLVLPVMLSLRMAGVGGCRIGVRLPEHSEVLQMGRRFAGFRERDSIESCLIYTTTYFSRYERAGILVENPFRNAKSILELSEVNIFALLTRTLYVRGEFKYPPREEVFMSLQGSAACGLHLQALSVRY